MFLGAIGIYYKKVILSAIGELPLPQSSIDSCLRLLPYMLFILQILYMTDIDTIYSRTKIFNVVGQWNIFQCTTQYRETHCTAVHCSCIMWQSQLYNLPSTHTTPTNNRPIQKLWIGKFIIGPTYSTMSVGIMFYSKFTRRHCARLGIMHCINDALCSCIGWQLHNSPTLRLILLSVEGRAPTHHVNSILWYIM